MDSRNVAGDVNAAGRIHGGAVAVTFELHKLSLVLERSVGLDIKCRKCGAIGNVDRLFIGTQNDTIGAEVLPISSNYAGRTRIEKATHCEIDAAFAICC